MSNFSGFFATKEKRPNDLISKKFNDDNFTEEEKKKFFKNDITFILDTHRISKKRNRSDEIKTKVPESVVIEEEGPSKFANIVKDLTIETESILENDSKGSKLEKKSKARDDNEKDSDSDLDFERQKQKKKKDKAVLKSEKNMKKKKVPIVEKPKDQRVEEIDIDESTMWKNKIDENEFEENIKKSRTSLPKTKSEKAKGMGWITSDKAKPLPQQKLFYPLSMENKQSNSNETIKSEFVGFLQTPQVASNDLVMIQKFLEQSLPKSSAHRNRDIIKTSAKKNIYTINRKEVKLYLRTPIPGVERPCCLKNDCEGMHLYGAERSVLREFYTAHEIEEIARDGKLPEFTRPCILCRLANEMFFWMQSEANKNVVNWELQSLKFRVDIEGEYDLQQCFMSNDFRYAGFLYPVIAHCRYYYKSSRRQDGVIEYDDVGYIKPFEKLNF